ncbi:MAG: NosD domain-containing protein [Candidatus Micrarchaeota archaeon]
MESRYPFLILGILAVFSLIPAAYAATPSIGLNVTYPAGNLSVNQYRFFHVTANVSCFTSDCGDINVSLDPLPPECTSYTPLDWDINSIYAGEDGSCSYGLTPGWYRLTGTYKAIPVQRPYVAYICNTHAPGFLDFSYPEFVGETTSGRICYHYSGSTCNWQSSGVQVTACNGYYVFYLTPPPGCNMQPCTTDLIPDPISEKTGLVNTTEGALPFYTNGTNPRTVNLNAGQSQLVTFWVNATGGVWNYTFFAYANLTVDPGINNQTGNWTVSIYPPPSVSFEDLPSFVKTPGPPVDVTINISAEYFFGAPDSATLDSVWWNHGAENISYSSPTVHSFPLGAYTVTAYANDTDGNVYSSTETLDVSTLACGDSVDSDLVMSANLDCSGYSGNAVEITGDNIVFDCNGYSITGPGNSYTGIYVDSLSNVTIQNCNVTDFYNGIYLYYGQDNRILHNAMGRNTNGLYLYYSDFNSVLYNDFNDNTVGFYLYRADSNQIGRNNATDSSDANFGSGSCPFLYLWNGSGYDYYTDLAGESIGAPWFETPLYEAGIYELGGFKPTNGVYKLKVREVIPESDFFDQMKMALVDVPEGYGVLNQWHNTYSDNAAPPKGFMTIKDPKRPVEALDNYGNNVLAQVSEKDGVPLPTLNREPNSVIVDFGQISNPEYAKLVITGWSSYESNPGLTSLKGLKIETIDAGGQWVVAKRFGKFTGDSRTFVFDIAGILDANDTRMRITAPYSKTTVNVMDQILLDDSEPVDIQVTYVDPRVADLHWGGATTYDYATTWHRHIVADEQLPNIEKFLMYGNFTRYGDVTPLLGSADDMFAIMRHGDEIIFEFDDIPPVDGKDRYAFLQADVMYSIRYSVNGFVSDSIDPLPFHGMSEYPYGGNESYPYDSEHLEYIENWNTRVYEPPNRAGGSLPYSFNNTVYENNIVGDQYSTGLYLEYEEETKLLYNNISEVEVGIEIYDSSDTTVTGNRVFSEAGRALLLHQDSYGSDVEDNVFRSDNSEDCYFEGGCGAVYLGKTYDNYFEGNEMSAIGGTGLAVGYSATNDFIENEISSTGEYYAVHIWGGLSPESKLLAESGNVFLRNSIQGDLWVYDEDGGNAFSDEDTGNAYSSEDGTPAATIFNITDTDGNGYADEGSDLPFSCNTVGNCDSDYYFWEGAGEDWHPFVSAPRDSDDDDIQTKPLSVEFTPGCRGNVVTVDGAGGDAHVVVKDSAGNVIAAGDTSGDEFTFSADCGLEGISIKATQSGFLPGTLSGQDTVSCSECGVQNETPGCTLDSGCLSNQKCVSGECVSVPCECGTVENRQCVPYACCSDSQCAADELCQNHVCAKKPQFECTADTQCPASKYCDIPTGASGGSCKDVMGQCGVVENHAFVLYGYECGSEPGCPQCDAGSSCSGHVCIPDSGLSCPTTGIVGDKKTCEAKENELPCANCDYVVTDPTGKNTTGRTDENGNFDLPLNTQGTYKVALMKDGAIVKVIEVKAFPQAQPEEPTKPAANGPDMGMMLMLLFLLLMVAAGIIYWRSRGKAKAK